MRSSAARTIFLLVAAATALLSSAVLGENGTPLREKRQTEAAAVTSLDCGNVFLARPEGSINSYRQCQRAPDDPTKYPNEADWCFRYDNDQTDLRWINVHYVIDIEKSAGCSQDKLTFGDSSDEKRLVMCGRRTGSFSLPLRPREAFLIEFKSDYSVGSLGFNLTYVVSNRPLFSTDLPRVLDGPSSPTTRPNARPTPAVFEGDEGSYVYPEYGTDPPPFNHYQYPEYADDSANEVDNTNGPDPSKYDFYNYYYNYVPPGRKQKAWSPWLNDQLKDQLYSYRYHYNLYRQNSGSLPTFWR